MQVSGEGPSTFSWLRRAQPHSILLMPRPEEWLFHGVGNLSRTETLRSISRSMAHPKSAVKVPHVQPRVLMVNSGWNEETSFLLPNMPPGVPPPRWSAQNINVMPLRPAFARTSARSGRGTSSVSLTGSGSNTVVKQRSKPATPLVPWLDGSRAEAQWAKRDPNYDDEFASKGAVPTMGSSSGSLGASRRGVFPSGRGRSELFDELKLSRTMSMDAIENRKAFRSLPAHLSPSRSDLRVRGLERVWMPAAPKVSPRASRPEEAREKAVRELSRGVGIMYDEPPLWTSRPNTPSLAGITI